jgi:hypothetical protein
MRFQFFKVFLLIGSVISSALNKQLYDRAKEKILFIAKEQYKQHGEIVKIEGIDCKKYKNAKESLSRIGTNDLLDLLNAEESEDFLTIYFYGYARLQFLVFRNLCSLSLLKNFPKYGIQLKEIFEKFLEFLFWRLRNVNNNCCSSPHDLSESINLLGKVEAFWNNKLERLAKRLLSKNEFMEQLKQYKTWLKFLYQFYNHGVEFMLIKEYKSLKQEIRLNGIENSTAVVMRFQFLVDHLKQHLICFKLPGSHEKFAWLTGRDALFIIYYFYFYNKFWNLGGIHQYNYQHLIAENYERMLFSVKKYIYPERNKFVIFWDDVNDPTLINLARTILKKTKKFITK